MGIHPDTTPLSDFMPEAPVPLSQLNTVFARLTQSNDYVLPAVNPEKRATWQEVLSVIKKIL